MKVCLTDIFGKRKPKLDFRMRAIGFVEDKASLKIKKKKKLTLRQVQQKQNSQAPELKMNKIKLIPPSLSTQKMLDLHPTKQAFFDFSHIYRFFQISPFKETIKQEVLRFGVIGISVIIILNIVGAYTTGITLKKDLEAKAFGVYSNLLEAADSAQQTDFLNMYYSFKEMSTLLTEAEELFIDKLKIDDNQISSPFQNVNLILRTGRHFSKAGEYLAKTFYNVKNLPAYFMLANNKTLENNNPNLKLTDRIKIDIGFLNLAFTEIENAEMYINEIEWNYLPDSFQTKAEELQNKIEEVKKIMGLAQEYIPYILDLLGDRYPQRYLVLLQNNHEIRATGGFIGSYILLDINDGEITKFELKDVYESDGQLHEKVEPPKGLHKITEDWKMRDANYSPDFPTSARQVMWFLEHEKGPTVDTVIAINQRVVENLLSQIGEVEMPGMDLSVSADNFSWIFSFLIEAKLSQTVTPKQFLIDFVPVFKNKLMRPQNIPAIFEVMQDSIKQKDLIVYSTDQEITNFIRQFGLSGEIASIDPTFDYLQVVNTSIGGNKSDGFIRQKIKHNTNIDAQGAMIDDLTVTRKHTWYHAEDAIFDDLYQRFGSGQLERQELKDIIGFGGNKNLMRVYVPLGSQLISATGSVSTEEVMVYEDLGKTVFAFEQPVVYTERESMINLQYKLPYQMDVDYADNYKIIIQNQPGQEQNHLSKSVEIEENLQILQQFPEMVFKENANKVSCHKFLEQDEYMSVVVGEER